MANSTTMNRNIYQLLHNSKISIKVYDEGFHQNIQDTPYHLLVHLKVQELVNTAL